MESNPGTSLGQGLNMFDVLSGRQRSIMYYSNNIPGHIFSAAWSSEGEKVIMTQGWYSNDTWYGSALTLTSFGLASLRNYIEIKSVRRGDRFMNPQNATRVFRDAIWSPNNLKIAFLYQGLLDENWIECPVVLKPDGSGMRKLEQCEADDHPRYWSVDGKWIVVWSERSPELYAYEVDGNRRLPLSQLGKILVYDERYYPWRVVDSPVCRGSPSFWNCE